MRLAAKLVLLFLVGLALIVAVFSYLTIEQNRQRAIDEHERHATDLVAALESAINEAMKQNDPRAMQHCLEHSAQVVRHLQVRWVKLNHHDGPHRPAAPPEWIVRRDVMTVRMRGPQDQPYLFTYVPLSDKVTGDQQDRIEIAAPDIATDDRLGRTLWSSLVALLSVTMMSAAVVVVGGWRMVGRPLDKLIDKVRRIGEGDFSQPLELRTADELSGLAIAINAMSDQLQSQRDQLEHETASRLAAVQQLRHNERLSTVGRLAAGIAHEIGTPLNVVSGRAQLIAGGQLDDSSVRESAETIRNEASRITLIVRELLDFARQRTPQRSETDVGRLIDSTADLMSPLAKKHNVTIETRSPAEPIRASIDANQIRQVLTNLIVNAIQSTRGGGSLNLEATTMTAKAAIDLAETNHFDDHSTSKIFRQSSRDGDVDPDLPLVQITVRDNGVGIAEEDLQHVFEPFFTTKDVGEGTGLGLSISHGIVLEHGGWIDVQTSPHQGTPHQGTEFSVYLPV